jgi:hypothetical protein
MNTWTKVLIGVLTLTITLETIYCFIKTDEAAKQEGVALIASESAEKAMREAEMQAELAEMAAAEAQLAQNEAEKQARLAQELSIELEKCKSKK